MESRRAVGWQRPALIVIAVAGIAISVYLTVTHLSAVPLVCTVGSVINCASVTHSAYSVIPGTSIPISVLGIVWFAISGALGLLSSPSPVADNFPPASPGEPKSSGSRDFPREQGQGGGLLALQLLWAALGLAVVLYLVFVEIVILHQLCEWCTVVHLLVLATFVVTVRQFQQA